MYKPGDLVWLDGEPGVVDEQQPGDTGLVPVRLVGGARKHAFKTHHLYHITAAEVVTLAEAMAGSRWVWDGDESVLVRSEDTMVLASWGDRRWSLRANGVLAAKGENCNDHTASASREFVRLCIEGTIKPVDGWGKAKQPATASSLPTLPLRVGERITEVTTSEGRRFRLASRWEEC